MTGTVRAAFHVHSTWSFDGRWSLETIAQSLRRRRYDIVMVSEHSQGLDQESWQRLRAACGELSDDRLLLVPGIEYRDPTNTVHTPVWGDIPFLGDGLVTSSLLERVADLGGLATLAHPGRQSAWRSFDPSWAKHLVGIEVWNRKYDGTAPSESGLRLSKAWNIPPLVSLDFHGRRQFFPLAMTVPSTGQQLSESLVLDALRARSLRPTFMRMPIDTWSTGPGRQALAVAEKARSGVAPWLRRSWRHQSRGA